MHIFSCFRDRFEVGLGLGLGWVRVRQDKTRLDKAQNTKHTQKARQDKTPNKAKQNQTGPKYKTTQHTIRQVQIKRQNKTRHDKYKTKTR